MFLAVLLLLLQWSNGIITADYICWKLYDDGFVTFWPEHLNNEYIYKFNQNI